MRQALRLKISLHRIGRLIFVTALYLFTYALAFAANAESHPPQYYLETYRTFAKEAQRINLNEPELYSDPRFHYAQVWTLGYQRYSSKKIVSDIRVLFVLRPQNVTLEQISSVFKKHSLEASNLAVTLLDEVENHLAMNPDPDFRRDYVHRYNLVLKTVFPSPSGELSHIQLFDCDYTTQPTDALWYMVNVIHLIDGYAESLFGDQWLVEKNKMFVENPDLLTVEEMRAHVEAGLQAP